MEGKILARGKGVLAIGLYIFKLKDAMNLITYFKQNYCNKKGLNLVNKGFRFWNLI